MVFELFYSPMLMIEVLIASLVIDRLRLQKQRSFRPRNVGITPRAGTSLVKHLYSLGS